VQLQGNWSYPKLLYGSILVAISPVLHGSWTNCLWQGIIHWKREANSKCFCSYTGETSEKPCFYPNGVSRLAVVERRRRVHNPFCTHKRKKGSKSSRETKALTDNTGQEEKTPLTGTDIWSCIFQESRSIWHYFVAWHHASYPSKKQHANNSRLMNKATEVTTAAANSQILELPLPERRVTVSMEVTKSHPLSCILMLQAFRVLPCPILFC